MLTQIEVEFGERSAPSALVIPIIGATPRDSLLVRKIDGLNPPKSNLFIGDYAQDGGTYQGRRVGLRNVVLTIELNPNPALGETISGLRELLEKIFMDPLTDRDYVKVNFFDDLDRIRYVVGYAESFETDIFDSVDNLVQVSLICPDPYIRNNERLMLRNAMGWTSVPMLYDGTAETGFDVEIYVAAPAPQLVLDLNGFKMELVGPFIKGQMIYMNTERGSRALLLSTTTELAAWYAIPGNEDKWPSEAWAGLEALDQTTSLIANLTSASDWLELHSQANTMKVYSTTSDPPDGAFAVRKLSYLPSYWGI